MLITLVHAQCSDGRLGIGVATATLACSSATKSDTSASAPVSPPPGTHVIPTRYLGDRFYATPVTTRGDTLTLFLDTGGGTLMWEPTVARFQLPIVDSIPARGGGFIRLVELPAFTPGRSVPPPITTTRYRTRLSVRSTADGFAAYISRSSLGQLGYNWFGDRIWTFDYPGRRLLLHDTAPPPTASPAHRVDVGFRTDSAGRRLDHSVTIGLAIDGDSLAMIFDTGATAWLTPEALARIGDGQPSERGTSLIWADVYDKWRARHPDWRVIENADLLTKQPVIEVPTVSIGGFDVGPVWFMRYDNGTPPPVPTYPQSTPTIKKMISGTIGGSTLRFFRVLLDYPRAVAEFTRPSPNSQ